MLRCSCCGGSLLDSPEENVSHGRAPYPHDTGFGMCRDCGGDPEGAKKLKRAGADDETVTRKAMGWTMANFVDARIPRLAEALSPENRARFEAMTYSQQAEVICSLVESGPLT